MRDDDDFDGDEPVAWPAVGAARPRPKRVIVRQVVTQASPFASAPGQVPWLEGLPPWHMWGNTLTIGPVTQAQNAGKRGSENQLLKVAYKRPESWHWLFAARILDGPTTIVGQTMIVRVSFDLIVGIGRSMQRMGSFDQFRWAWNDGQSAPTGHTMWATSALTPALNYTQVAGFWTPDDTTRRNVDQIVAQDIQCVAVLAVENVGGPITDTVTVEMAGFLAPKTHVRPDWFVDGPPGATFPGSETGGK